MMPTALIVNDDSIQLRIVAEILARDGFEALSCRGAEEALVRLGERGKVDLIVTDLYMPGIDGWRLCRLLRSSAYEAFNKIPILVASATFSGSDADEVTAQLGADGFLPAPYEPAVLRRMARDLVGNARPVRLPHVLIVVPEPAAMQSLKDVFEASGYSVTCAVTGDEALARLRGESAQIVILDYDYAEVRAEALIETVKQPASSTAVIVMTADRSAELALGLMRQGADNYAHKPMAPDFILHLCESAARQHALPRVEELLEQRTRRLRDSEERYRTLFENASVGILTYSLDGVVIGVNLELETLSGASRDDLTGKLSKQRMDLRMAVERLVERYQCEAQPGSMRLELTAREAAMIEGDALALDRVFANLLQNAFKFKAGGGAISMNIARRGSDAVVEVRDNGPGIDPEKMPELFQKFSRIETGERREGLGLGLYIVSQLVDAHGGRVEAESAIGNGACFSVFLPLAGDA